MTCATCGDEYRESFKRHEGHCVDCGRKRAREWRRRMAQFPPEPTEYTGPYFSAEELSAADE